MKTLYPWTIQQPPVWWRRGRHALLLAALAALAGCAAGPNYQGPPSVDLGHRPELLAPEVADTLPLERWWEQLGDPTLARLVNQALANNLDLRGAVLRIEEARAALTAWEARNVPEVEASASAVARRQTLNGPLPVMNDRDQVIYDAGLRAGWEPDLFGRVRRGIEYATAQTEAAQADADGVRLAVATEVARAYLSLKAAQHELAARQSSIATIKQVVDLTRKRVDLGDLPATEMDVVNLRLQNAQAVLPGLLGRIRTAALALGVLTGGLPEQELALETALPGTLRWPDLPVGQRVDLLARRPDIRAAERRLAASVADVGLAQAERFPRLTITASGGFQALDLGDLVKESSQALSLVPLISWRIFDGGRVKAVIRASEARHQSAAIAYERTVLNVLSEVERSLEDYRRARESLGAHQAVTKQAQHVLDTAVRRYAHGDVTRLEVLEAEREHSEALEALARSTANAANSFAFAIKALGGGWRDQSPTANRKVGADMAMNAAGVTK